MASPISGDDVAMIFVPWFNYAMKFKKAILRVGRYESPDGTLNVTPTRLKNWERQFNAMTAARQVVPMGWDHADTEDGVLPLSADDYKSPRSAKNTVGAMSRFTVAKDSQSAEIFLDITDPEAQRKAVNNVVYVSPVVTAKWRDGHGNQYSDCLTHIDLVNHPVDYSQGKFESADTLACSSLRLGLSAPYQEAGHMKKTKRLSADKPEDDDLEGAGGDIPEAMDSEPPIDDEPVDDGGDAILDSKNFDHMVSLLEEFGVKLPGDTTPDNIVPHLRAALSALIANKAGAEAGKGEDGGEDATPQVKQPELSMLSLDKQPHYQYAVKMHRNSVTERLDNLLASGRCTPAEHRREVGGVGKIRLSLDASGQPAVSRLEQWIDSRADIPPGTFWDDSQRTLKLSSTVVHGHPSNGVETIEEAERIATEIYTRK